MKPRFRQGDVALHDGRRVTVIEQVGRHPKTGARYLRLVDESGRRSCAFEEELEAIPESPTTDAPGAVPAAGPGAATKPHPGGDAAPHLYRSELP